MADAEAVFGVSSSNVRSVYKMSDGTIGIEFKDGSKYTYAVPFSIIPSIGGIPSVASWGSFVWSKLRGNESAKRTSITVVGPNLGATVATVATSPMSKTAAKAFKPVSETTQLISFPEDWGLYGSHSTCSWVAFFID